MYRGKATNIYTHRLVISWICWYFGQFLRCVRVDWHSTYCLGLMENAGNMHCPAMEGPNHGCFPFEDNHQLNHSKSPHFWTCQKSIWYLYRYVYAYTCIIIYIILYIYILYQLVMRYSNVSWPSRLTVWSCRRVDGAAMALRFEHVFAVHRHPEWRYIAYDVLMLGKTWKNIICHILIMLYSNKSSPCWWVKPWKYGFMTLLYQHSGLRNVKASEFGDSLPFAGVGTFLFPSINQGNRCYEVHTRDLFWTPYWMRSKRSGEKHVAWKVRPKVPWDALGNQLGRVSPGSWRAHLRVIPNWIKKLENEMMGLILPILERCGIPWNSTHLGAPDFSNILWISIDDVNDVNHVNLFWRFDV